MYRLYKNYGLCENVNKVFELFNRIDILKYQRLAYIEIVQYHVQYHYNIMYNIMYNIITTFN